MASIKSILYTHKKLNDNSHPIMIQVIHKRKIKRIAIGHSLFKEQWDKENNLPNKKAPNYKSLRTLIQKKLSDANLVLIKLENEKGNNFEIEELIDKISNKRASKSFTNYTNNLIEIMNDSNRIGNGKSYKKALNVFSKFLGKNDISFNDVNYKNLIKFRDNHLKSGFSINGHNVYTRAIRAIYNKAIKEGLINPSEHPFDKYSIKNTKTAKRALTKEDMIKIANLELKKGDTLWHAKNYFMFSFHLIGINFIDMAYLKIKNIEKNRIKYVRQKTHKPYDIAINSEIKKILDFYTINKRRNDYIFPIINRNTPQDIYLDIRNALRLYKYPSAKPHPNL